MGEVIAFPPPKVRRTMAELDAFAALVRDATATAEYVAKPLRPLPQALREWQAAAPAHEREHRNQIAKRLSQAFGLTPESAGC